MSFVLDNSVAMLWLLPQSNPSGIGLAEKVLTQLSEADAVVPSLWWLEASNVISKSLRIKKISQAQASTFIVLLDELNIETDGQTDQRALHGTLDLACRYGLSAYDAAYLDLALRKTMPIATLDERLVAAANEAGVPVMS
jgi:predicted nucleic acid-binding protein